ncbi:MAG: M42 family metallopeptidase [Bacillota bacterium]
MRKYLDYSVEQILALCAIPSPSGYTKKASEYLISELIALGYSPSVSNKGAVLVELGGTGEPLVISAHVDTLGAMVRSINAQGRLQLTMIGGYPENYVESENCVIHTRCGKQYSGCILLKNPAVHVNREIADTKRNFANMEVVIDEKVATVEDVKKLGISAGDFVSLDPRTVLTTSGFIKSRHLDDKAGSGLLLGVAKYFASHKMTLGRKVYLFFTVYEEVGHGGACGFPADVREMLVVDMGAVGDDLGASEHVVSICAKDSRSPYDYDVTNKLIATAKTHKLEYAVDIYPFYGSDAAAALAAGHDIRHGLIGPGVAASHGYERTHVDGLENTLKLIIEYIKRE